MTTHTRPTIDELFHRVSAGDHQSMEKHILDGCDIHCLSPSGFSLLAIAVMQKDPIMVQILLNAGADPNVIIPDFTSVLYVATLLKDEKIVQMLIDYGANVNIVHKISGIPAFHEAFTHDHEPIVRAFLNAGVDVNIKNMYQQTVLHLLCGDYTILALIDCVIEYGASINAQDKKGNTPAHWCTSSDNLQPLIAAGASLLIKNNEGKIPLEHHLQHPLTHDFLSLLKNATEQQKACAENALLHHMLTQETNNKPHPSKMGKKI